MSQFRHAFLLALIVCALFASACTSTTRQVESIQPFHVAVIPITAAARLADPDGSKDDAVTISIDASGLANAVRSAVDGTCFTRASLLAPPAGVSPEDFDGWDVARRDAHWLAEAQRLNADLVLECDLAFAEKAVGESNEKFWLNLPLFLLGGPGCYFIADRTYHGDARLRASLYELHAIADDRASFADGRSRLVQIESRFRNMSLDFIDRADGAGNYAVSLVVPAGLLASDGEGVEGALSSAIGLELAAGLARELSLQQREIRAADRVAPFQLDPRVQVALEGDDVLVTGSVLLKRGDVDRMEEFVVRSGSAVVNGEFEDGAVDEFLSTRREQVLRYAFTARLPRSQIGPFVGLEMAAGGRTRIVRSFTLPLDVQAETVEIAKAEAPPPR